MDPRFTTMYEGNYTMKKSNMTIPRFSIEKWCEPGYQEKRPNKGYVLTVNDYPFNKSLKYSGGIWDKYVYTD